MKNFSKNKLLLCFRPVDHMDAMFEAKVAAHRSKSKNQAKLSDSWIMQKTPKRTVSRFIKAVVFETIMNRRSSHKSRYCFGGSKHKYSTHQETKALQSSHGSVTSSSSSNTKELPQSNNLSSTKEKEKEDSYQRLVGKQKKFELYAICLFVISLAFTVFCGKLFGIMLTSIWLYFFSLWNSSYCCQKLMVTSSRQREYSRVECKEKVTLWKK